MSAARSANIVTAALMFPPMGLGISDAARILARRTILLSPKVAGETLFLYADEERTSKIQIDAALVQHECINIDRIALTSAEVAPLRSMRRKWTMAKRKHLLSLKSVESRCSRMTTPLPAPQRAMAFFT
jgi:hypothetical protein